MKRESKMDAEINHQVDAIRQLNDTLRRSGTGGRTVLTSGFAALAPETLVAALRAVAAFDTFTPDNDPYGEHDCASLDVHGHQVLWKIDYYDPSLQHHSDDATNPAITQRVLTIMLTDEY
jgi:hypothetical protein